MKVRECYNEVEQEDEGRQSIVQESLRKSTDFLRRIIVPGEGQGRAGRSQIVVRVTSLSSFPA